MPTRFTPATASDDATTTLDSVALLELVAHRFPFLLVDRVTIVEPGRRAIGRKRVTGNEWCSVFSGDGRPFPMPGLLVVEALAQTSAAVLLGLTSGDEEMIGYFAAIRRVRLRDPAQPGDTLDLAIELRDFRRGIGRLRGVATVEQRFVGSAEFVTVIRPRSAMAR